MQTVLLGRYLHELRECTQGTGHCVNLLHNSNFSWRDRTIQSGKSGNVLFSGFLVAFLGASGIQTSISGNFDTLTNTVPVTEVTCQEHFGVKAIIADSALQKTETTKREPEIMEEECQQDKEIQKTLESELTLTEPHQEGQELSEAEKEEKAQYEKRVAELEVLLKGHPLAEMAPAIAEQDPEIAALIVGIARKESQWGLRSPKKNGDCFNYWGFKGAGDRGTGMGYACFATREEAVEKIANRLEKLVDKRGTSKPSALVTPWKCGNSCATHSPESVQKWVSDVNQYYTKVLAMK